MEQLFAAIRERNVPLANSLLENNILSMNVKVTALYLAAEFGCPTIASNLIENYGVNPNQQNEHNWNKAALHIAARHGHVNVIKSLIKNGANSSQKSHHGKEAIHFAAEGGHLSIITSLITEYNILPNQSDDDGVTALYYAVMFNRVNVIKYLAVNHDVDVNQRHGIALSKAFHLKDQESILTLIKLGAKISAEMIDTYNSKAVNNLLKSTLIMDKIVLQKKLSAEDRTFIESNDFSIAIVAPRFETLVYKNELDFTKSLESFNLLTKGTWLANFFDRSGLYDSTFESYIPKFFGTGKIDLGKYFKEVMATMAELIREDEESIPFDQLLRYKAELIESYPELANKNLYHNFQKLHALYCNKNYVELFLKQLIQDSHSFPMKFAEVVEHADYKPARILQDLVNDNHIYLSRHEKTILNKLIDHSARLEADLTAIVPLNSNIDKQPQEEGNIDFNILALKAADSLVDGAKFIYQPTVEHAKTLTRDVIHLQSIILGDNIYSLSLSTIDIYNQMQQGEYFQAGITAGYAFLPILMGPYAPAYRTAITIYSAYSLAANAYSFSDYNTPAAQLKSNLAYDELANYWGWKESAKEYLSDAAKIVIEENDPSLQDVAQEHHLMEMLGNLVDVGVFQ